MFCLENLVRKNIKTLAPYSSARDEFSGKAEVLLDANENPLGSPINKCYNRYPDPRQLELKKQISGIKKVDVARIFLGNGSDECIDLLFRCFCRPGKDNVIIMPPTYGMYQVSAAINDVAVREAPLDEDFQPNPELIRSLIDENTKIIWFCSPNNPSGNHINRGYIEEFLENFNGIVVVDEAYANFSREVSFLSELSAHPNLVVLQTFSKAWGLAGLRLGLAFASPSIIEIMSRVKPPYNINQATQDLAMEALKNLEWVNDGVRQIVGMRMALSRILTQVPGVMKVYPSDANFLLVKIKDADRIYDFLVKQGIIVRNRSRVLLCNDCLRITIGTEKENTCLLEALLSYFKQIV